MVTFTEKLDHNITLVKTVIKTVTYNIGSVEQGNGNVFMATNYENRTLKDTDNCIIFRDFEEARKAIIKSWESEFGR